MLVLTRRPGESIILEIPGFDSAKVTLLDNGKIGIEAPEDIQIIREELLDEYKDELPTSS